MTRIVSLLVLLAALLVSCSEKKEPVTEQEPTIDEDTIATTDEVGELIDDDETMVTDDSLPIGVHKINGIDPEQPMSDLHPFGEHVKDATLVGLGEPLHRSGGFLKAKHRLMRYLVQEKGFRVIAFETEWTRAERIQEYLQTCEGDVDAIVKEGMRFIWQSREIADLITWLCVYNKEHPTDPVSFFGFNNFQPWDDAPVILDFVGKSMPGETEQLITDIKRCQGVNYKDEEEYYNNVSVVLSADHIACIAALDMVEQYLDDNEENLSAVFSPYELRWLRTRIISLRGWEDYNYGSMPEDGDRTHEAEGINSRDKAMAFIMMTMIDILYPDKKIVYSSHSLHANQNSETLDLVYPVEYDGYMENLFRMGNYLAEEWGDKYRPIGLMGYKMSYENMWLPYLPDEQENIPEGAPIIEYLLHETGESTLFVDIAYAEKGETPFLKEGEKYRFCVPQYFYGWHLPLYEIVPHALFSGIFFLDESPFMAEF